MQCALQEVDLLQPLSDPALDELDLIYRPLYFLSGYANTAKRWRDDWIEAVQKLKRIKLKLEEVMNQRWATLGFPQFDAVADNPTSISKESLCGWEVELSVTGISSFNVGRGMW
jgi:hypothetical protein